MAKKILYVSGSIGLGHISRDLAIATELRKQNPQVQVSWLAAHPASILLKETGENILPEADQYASDSIPAETAAKQGFYLNIWDYLSNAESEWAQNAQVFARVIRDREFDLIVADEAYEILGELLQRRIQLEVPFVALFDFFGDDSVTGDPVKTEAAQESNRDFWTQLHHLFSDEKRLGIFIGELEDIPDKSLGPDLPDRRDYAKEVFEFVGYTLRFDPVEYTDRAKIRTELGYGEETLVICSIGGTSVGKELLTLCAEAYPLVSQRVSNLRMMLVCGPRLEAGSLSVPPGVEVMEYIPELYKHFAACDLAIVQGGGTSTLELTALRRPFLYFPLEGHYEQQIHVAHRLRRHRAGVGLSYSQTTAASLADAMVANLGKGVDYAPIATDGAQRSAQLITRLI